LTPTGDTCDINKLGRTLENGHLGTMITDRKGNASIHNFRDFDIDDIIGMTVVLQGRYEDFAYRSSIYNIAAQTEAEQVVMGMCMCSGAPINTPTGNTAVDPPVPGPLMLPCGEDPCPATYCEANGYACPFCNGANASCTGAVPCPPDNTCVETIVSQGNTLCFNCDAPCATAPAVTGCRLETSILNRPACGIIEEVECPQPEYIKNILY
jgi:hypothetical protein